MTIDSARAVELGLRNKSRVTATLEFETGWRIGSGKPGETMSDLGVVLTPAGDPLLPGSSIKGRLRGTCEGLAHALGLSACMLDHDASGVACTSDISYYRRGREEYRKASREGLASRLAWIGENTCDVCKLFGSPLRVGRLRVSDGELLEWSSVVQVRDGVVIDRDSQTAVPRLKYDYEVLPAGSRFGLCFDLENARDQDLALLGAALFEWHAGSSIGGFTSRGLGRFVLKDICVTGVDLDNPEQRIRFLTSKTTAERLSDIGPWDQYFQNHIEIQMRWADSERG